MKRLLDLVLSSLLLIVLSPILLIISLLIKIVTRAPVLYWSERAGYNNKPFQMPKFRSMIVTTPLIASNSMINPENYLTPLGRFLRRTSLDELPQLFCVLSGKMSLVGPRPVIFSEVELIDIRTQKGVHKLRPGITGWAQVNGRDNLSIQQKVALDHEYLQKKSVLFDTKILLLTLNRVFKQKDIYY